MVPGPRAADHRRGDDHVTTDVNTSKKLLSPPPSSLHYDDPDPRPRMEVPAGDENSISTYYPAAAARDENAALLLSAGDEVVPVDTSARNALGHVEDAGADQEQEMENVETTSSRGGCCQCCTKKCVLILLLVFLVLAGGTCVLIFVPWFDGWSESLYTRSRKGECVSFRDVVWPFSGG
ncbi:unnamed protein product, partial [Amoebophrya sp. A120]|eukprot:GSA120T00021923001.1